MKKAIYYTSPFVICPIVFLLFALLDGIDGINPNILIISAYIIFFLFAALMGSLSSANKRFDCAMTAGMPAAMFVALFIGLLFDPGCDGAPQLLLRHALNMEYYCAWLPIAAVMAVTAFITSFKPIRIVRER